MIKIISCTFSMDPREFEFWKSVVARSSSPTNPAFFIPCWKKLICFSLDSDRSSLLISNANNFLKKGSLKLVPVRLNAVPIQF